MNIKFDSDFSMTINGKSLNTPAKITVINPANETIVGYAPDCTPELLDAAVKAATEAFGTWSKVTFNARQVLLGQMADALEAHTGELSTLLTAEQGKTLNDAAMEIGGAAYWLRETAKMTLPETVNDESDTHHSITRHVPLGVIGAIAPWNYPIGLSAFKLASALLTGNTVVLKPSPFTPLTTLKMGEIMQGVLPEGVLNVISGADQLGQWMTCHPGLAKISFTGSTATGRKVMEGASATLKHLTLELGGNDAAIVLPDADIATVAKCLFWTSFGNSGQICLAAKRIYIHTDIYEPMRDALIAYAKTVVMGNGADDGVQLGPVQNWQQYERVLGLIRDCVNQGYTLFTGNTPVHAKGFFVPVTIVDNPPHDSRIVQEEQFGPVLPLIKFDDIDEVIKLANATEYGLGATVWSADPVKGFEVGQQLQAGTVWINEALSLSPLVTFAGHKQSGFGTESGQEGLLAYTVPQTIAVRQNAGDWTGVPAN